MIAQGIARYTADIDATVLGAKLDLGRTLAMLARHDIRPRIADAMAFARQHQILLVRHEPSGVDIDVSLAWLPFEEEAVRAHEQRDFAGVTIHVARPEDLLIYKLVAARPRDLDDAEKLLVLHAA